MQYAACWVLFLQGRRARDNSIPIILVGTALLFFSKQVSEGFLWVWWRGKGRVDQGGRTRMRMRILLIVGVA